MARWIHTGGGYYENEDTDERIRGKKNLPEGAELSPFAEATTDDIADEDKEIVCMTCHKVTVHTPRSGDSSEWSLHTCSECGGKTRVSLK